MSCMVTFNILLDDTGDLVHSVERVLAELQAAGFRGVDELTGQDKEGVLDASQFLNRGSGTDRGFGTVARKDCEVRVSFRGELNGAGLQAVALDFVDAYFRGPQLEARLADVVQLVRRLHQALNARRTIAERGLEDGLVPYDWVAEWHRLDRGLVEGRYWLDMVRKNLASAEYEARSRDGAEKPLMFKRFSWGTYLRLRFAP